MSDRRTGAPLVPLGDLLVDCCYGTNELSGVDGKTPVVGISHVRDGKVRLTGTSRVDLPSAERDKLALRPGDILLTRTNSHELVGQTGLVEVETDAVFASYLVRLRVDRSRVEPAYLNFWLNSPAGQRQVRRIATRAVGQANVNPTEFKKHVRVPLPPLRDQQRIANALSTWDSAIDKAERLSLAIDSRNRWLAARLVGGARKRRGSVLLGDIARFQIGRTPSRDVPGYWAGPEDTDSETWLSISDLAGGGLVTESRERITPAAVRDCSMTSVATGALLMSFKLTIGRVAIAGRTLFTNEAIVALTPHGDGFDVRFLYHLLPLLDWGAIGNQAAKGQTLNREGLRTIRIPRIPLTDQADIARRLDEAIQQRDVLERAARALRAQKAAISSNLLWTRGGGA